MHGARKVLNSASGITALNFFFKRSIFHRHILEDPGADSGGEGKSKRAEKYGTKKSKQRREEPLGTTSYQTSSKRSPQKNTKVFWHQSEVRTAATVWNWSGKTFSVPRGSSRRSLLFFVLYFPARSDFPSPPLSAPGSPRMTPTRKPYRIGSLFSHKNGDFGAIFVREQSCSAAPILKVDRIVTYRIGFCCFYNSSLHIWTDIPTVAEVNG